MIDVAILGLFASLRLRQPSGNRQIKSEVESTRGDDRLGLSPAGATPSVYWPVDLRFGTRYRVVHTFERGSGTARLWVDPIDAASPSIVAATSSNAAIQTYAFRQAPGNTTQWIDHLLVADRFAEVLGDGAAPDPSAPTLVASDPSAGAGAVDPAIGAVQVWFSTPLAAATDAAAWSVRCPPDGADQRVSAVALDLSAGTATIPVVMLPAPAGCQVRLPPGSVVGAEPGRATDSDLTLDFSTAAPSACGDGQATPIWAIQGDGPTSPLIGQTHSIEGVMVGSFQATDGNGLSGFFVQEDDRDADGDPATADGIFVFNNACLAPPLALGTIVRVTGQVAEFRRASDHSGNTLTQLHRLSAVEVCTGLSGSASPARLQLPLGNDPMGELESVEGMAVILAAADAELGGELALVEYFNLDRFGEIRVAAGGRPEQFTMHHRPDAAGFAAHQADLPRRTLLIDDGRSGQNRDPILFGRGGLPLDVQSEPPNLLRGSDSVAEIRGVLHYDSGLYRIQPTSAPEFVARNQGPQAPPQVAGRLRIASFNVLNYFQQFNDGTAKCGPPGFEQPCRGADAGLLDHQGCTERDRQEQKLIPALLALDADIYGLIEVENDFGAGGTTSAQRLADLMNAQQAVVGSK